MLFKKIKSSSDEKYIALLKSAFTWSQPHKRVVGGENFSKSKAVSLMTSGFKSLNLFRSRGISSGTFCQKNSQSQNDCSRKHTYVVS